MLMMQLFWDIPIIFKIAGVFSMVLFLIRRKQHLGTALLAGSVLLGLWCRMKPGEIAASMGVTLIQTRTIMLNAIVVQILILSHSMDKLEQMKRLLGSFQGLVQNVKFNLVLFPALIGLLPMPGGAIFSAPMVDEIGREHALDPETKSLLNYWFRHVWEYALPLYPGVLLAASMASVSVWAFVSRSFPLTLASIGVGYIFFLRDISLNPLSKYKKMKQAPLAPFLRELIPIAFVIAGAISGSLCITWLQPRFTLLQHVPAELPLVLSLFLSILYVWNVNNASVEVIRSILMNKTLLKMIYMITAIYIFKQILVDSQAVVELSSFLAAQHIPPLLVVIMLPAIIGFIAGISVAFVGTTFPVLISLLQTLHLEANMIPYLVLAFSSGFIGVMFSPLHVCFIFTREYFESDFRRLYHRIWKPLSAMMIVTLLYFSLLVLMS